jgi:hypothetical protein
MNPERIKLPSRRMSGITMLFLVGMLLLNAVSLLFPALNKTPVGFAGPDLQRLGIALADLVWWQVAGGIVLSSIPLLALAKALMHVRSLFEAFGRQDFFSPSAALDLERAGRWVVCWVLAGFVCEPVESLWFTLLAGPGRRMLTLTFGSPQFVALYPAGCVVVLVRVLRKASEISQENRQFV